MTFRKYVTCNGLRRVDFLEVQIAVAFFFSRCKYFYKCTCISVNLSLLEIALVWQMKVRYRRQLIHYYHHAEYSKPRYECIVELLCRYPAPLLLVLQRSMEGRNSDAKTYADGINESASPPILDVVTDKVEEATVCLV